MLDEMFAESCEGEIRFDEGSAMAYWRVFEYLYSGDYIDDLKIEGLQADMFFVKDLKVLALTKMKHRLKAGWKSKSFPTYIKEIYTITRSSYSIRLAVAWIAAEHGKDL
ncbi:BTB POZ fold domain containing [Pyrenophora seminiperda CCB06]|uniref:BTB POZ fold domain containing n=1 Tax=Pyrenophora seminiperda CCB06 TaxID=1302712 RepID=A0A3M7LXP8_9PLEO|nr:BTB POZ fold domain containing [Pyrenophora seminiperda CCB06]